MYIVHIDCNSKMMHKKCMYENYTYTHIIYTVCRHKAQIDKFDYPGELVFCFPPISITFVPSLGFVKIGTWALYLFL